MDQLHVQIILGQMRRMVPAFWGANACLVAAVGSS